MWPASTPLAMSPGRRCWRTRRNTKASLCVEAIKGLHPHRAWTRLLIPGCTYCHPQVASGRPYRGRKQRSRGYDGEASAAFLSSPTARRSRSARDQEGLVKTIFDKPRPASCIGAHMIGAEVTELIQGFVVAMNLRDHRGRTDEHGLPASDPVGNDARERCSTRMDG